MKRKLDFVTNSSSTSFILRVESKTDDPDIVLNFINEAFQIYSEKNGWDNECNLPALLTPDRVVKKGPNKFIIEDYLPYYKDDGDIPGYIKDLLSKLKDVKDGQISDHGDIKSMAFEIINKNE